jgi:hypothetical protein
MTEETKKIDWTKVWKFVKSKLFIALIIIGFIILSAIQCSRIKELQRQDAISDQNIIALNDSIKYEKQKNGSLQASIASYIASKKELEELNKELYDLVEAQEGDVISLTDAIIQLRQDSVWFQNHIKDLEKKIEDLVKIDENTYAAPWTLRYQYDSLNFDSFSGRTYIKIINKDPLELAHMDTELTNRLTQINLIWGQKVENGVLRVFVQSNYPGFTVAQLQGVMIDPADWPDIFKQPKRHWFQGVSLGVGITGGWNFMTQKTSVVIGPTFSYSIYTW